MKLKIAKIALLMLILLMHSLNLAESEGSRLGIEYIYEVI